MSRPLRIECYLIPLYRFWALTSECECAFSHGTLTTSHLPCNSPPKDTMLSFSPY